MLKRSLSERGHSAHVKAIGVKVLPSTFRMPPLRATGIDIRNPLPVDSARSGATNGQPRDLSVTVSSEFNGATHARWKSGTCANPSDQTRRMSCRSFDDLDLDELTESERDLKIDCAFGRAERDRRVAYEVAEAERLVRRDAELQEVLRLDDILRMCAEYEQKLQAEKTVRQPPSHASTNSPRSCTMTKIKTNGSLTSPVHIRRFAELSKERYSNSHLPPIDCFQVHPEAAHPSSLGPSELVPDSEWTNGSDPLSSQSSSDFLDGSSSSPPIRSQSFYENNDDDVFSSFHNDDSSSSDCLNNDDAVIKDSPSHLPPTLSSSSSSHYVAPVSTEEAGLSRRYLLADVDISENSTRGVGDKKTHPKNQGMNSELAKLKKMKIESLDRMERSKNRINEIDCLQEKVIHELENELEMLQTEKEVELASARLEDERVAVVKEQQMELLMQAAREREECQQQLETERRKLEELEANQRETRKRLESSSSVEIQSQLLPTFKKDKEAVDTQQRVFDDLEFNLLELETKREEEREPMQKKLAAELDDLLQRKSQREETLSFVGKQKLEILQQTNADVRNMERERHSLMGAFKKERLVYVAIVEKFTQFASRLRSCNDGFPPGTGNIGGEENGHGLEYLSSSVADDLCRTPPTRVRIRRTLMSLEQERQPPSVQRWASMGIGGGGVSSGVLDSECSTEVSGDVSPSSKVFSSGSEDSSFNSLEGMLKEDAARTEMESKSQDHLPQASEEKLFEPGKSQGSGRGLGRSLSEPRKTARLELNSTDRSAMTDQEVRFRENQRSQARPLTRYLPVRDKALDLRGFVESSGHSLDDSSQVLVGASTCCGYLKKRGGKFRAWHRRWFVFDRSRRCLTYFVDRTERKLRRSIYFQSIVDVFVDHLRTVLSPNQKLTFCLKALDRRYYLVAPTAEAMRIWIDVLFTGAEGYQEFC